MMGEEAPHLISNGHRSNKRFWLSRLGISFLRCFQRLGDLTNLSH